MKCPLCIDQQLQPNYRAGIEIDVCPQCRGVWLDRGELDRLAVSQPDPPPTPRPPDRSSRDREKADRWDDDRDRDRWEDDRDDDRRRDDRSRPRKRSKKRRLAEKLGDALEEVLDL